MKMRKFLACLLLVLLVTLSLTPAVFADVVFSGEEETLTGEYDATVFLAGQNPTSTADIKGIYFAAGNTVSTTGSSEYAFAAGNMLTYAGAIGKDGFIGGNTVSFTGDCGRDLYVAGNAVEIDGHIGRDLTAGGKTVVISGPVDGNVKLTAEEIVIKESAKIAGTLSYNASAKISAPAAVLSGAEVYEDKSDSGSDSTPAAVSAPSPLSKIKSKVFSFLGLLLIAYFLLWLTPLWSKVNAKYAGKGFGTYAGVFGIGFAVLAAVPIAAILLMITGFGLRAAFVLLFIYVAALLASPIFLGFFLGRLLWRKAFKKNANAWIELPIGLCLVTLLKLVPYLGFAVGLVSVCLGLGVIARLFGKKRAETNALTEQ